MQLGLDIGASILQLHRGHPDEADFQNLRFIDEAQMAFLRFRTLSGIQLIITSTLTKFMFVVTYKH